MNISVGNSISLKQFKRKSPEWNITQKKKLKNSGKTSGNYCNLRVSICTWSEICIFSLCVICICLVSLRHRGYQVSHLNQKHWCVPVGTTLILTWKTHKEMLFSFESTMQGLDTNGNIKVVKTCKHLKLTVYLEHTLLLKTHSFAIVGQCLSGMLISLCGVQYFSWLHATMSEQLAIHPSVSSHLALLLFTLCMFTFLMLYSNF